MSQLIREKINQSWNPLKLISTLVFMALLTNFANEEITSAVSEFGIYNEMEWIE